MLATTLRRACAAAALLVAALIARPVTAQAPLDAAPVRAAVARLVSDVRGWGGAVGVQIVDLDTGAVVASFAEHAAFNPASNAKLATAAAALHTLGAQHRFVTGLYGKVAGDTVDELVLRGDGDPTLRTVDLSAMAVALRASGVRHVRAIAVDQSFFDDRYVPPAFDQQPHEWAAFRAPVAPVSLNGNTVVFSVRATKDGRPAVVDVDPPGFVEVSGSVITAPRGESDRVTVTLDPRGSKLAARIGGKVPAGRRIVRIVKRVDDPRLVAGHALRAELERVGIDVRSAPRLGGANQKALLLLHRSAPLGDILPALGKDSDNFSAEMLFKAIGAKANGRPASASAAADAVRADLKRMGAFEPGMIVKNGSGLFDANRATPAATTALLRAMARDTSSGPEYVAHLAVGGVDGTLRGRFRGWADAHAVRAKTGTLNAVAALSGYVVGPSQRRGVAFSIFVNGISGKVRLARAAMDKVVEAAAREVWSGAPRH